MGTALGLAMVTLPPPNPFSPNNAVAAMPAARPAALAAQTSREGNVSVTVIPRNFSPEAASWDFEISFESHTQAVDQDLTKAAVLIDAAGKSHAPIGWEGDPPGGHHRKGLLRFKPLAGKPTSVELRIQGIGGVEVRAFRWRLE
jgi:hypothetical protein